MMLQKTMSNEGSKASFFRGKDKHQEIKTSLASSPRSKKQPSHLSFSEMFKRSKFSLVLTKQFRIIYFCKQLHCPRAGTPREQLVRRIPLNILIFNLTCSKLLNFLLLDKAKSPPSRPRWRSQRKFKRTNKHTSVAPKKTFQ